MQDSTGNNVFVPSTENSLMKYYFATALFYVIDVIHSFDNIPLNYFHYHGQKVIIWG